MFNRFVDGLVESAIAWYVGTSPTPSNPPAQASTQTEALEPQRTVVEETTPSRKKYTQIQGTLISLAVANTQASSTSRVHEVLATPPFITTRRIDLASDSLLKQHDAVLSAYPDDYLHLSDASTPMRLKPRGLKAKDLAQTIVDERSPTSLIRASTAP
jgi:hypothetical protein